MDHYSRNTVAQIEVLLAQQAGLLVDEVIHEAVDLLPVWVGRILGLLEEVSGWVLQGFHNLNIMVVKHLISPFHSLFSNLSHSS